MTSVDETGHTPLMVTIWRGDDGVKSFDFLMESEQVLKSLAVKNADGSTPSGKSASYVATVAKCGVGTLIRGRFCGGSAGAPLFSSAADPASSGGESVDCVGSKRSKSTTV